MADDITITLDGETYSADELTFREQREMRKLVRELVEDPKADMEEVSIMDVLPVLAFIVIHRTKPEFTLEEALDMKISDILPEEDEAESEERPTEAPPAAQ